MRCSSTRRDTSPFRLQDRSFSATVCAPCDSLLGNSDERDVPVLTRLPRVIAYECHRRRCRDGHENGLRRRLRRRRLQDRNLRARETCRSLNSSSYNAPDDDRAPAGRRWLMPEKIAVKSVDQDHGCTAQWGGRTPIWLHQYDGRYPHPFMFPRPSGSPPARSFAACPK
jgi:hypothetical protein